jgi:hypothetical protein
MPSCLNSFDEAVRKMYLTALCTRGCGVLDPPPNTGIANSSSAMLQAGRLGFESPHFQGFSLFATACRPTLGPTQPSVQWILGFKWLGRQADHSLLLLKLRIRGATSISLQVFTAWCLVKYRHNFTSTFYKVDGPVALEVLRWIHHISKDSYPLSE